MYLRRNSQFPRADLGFAVSQLVFGSLRICHWRNSQLPQTDLGFCCFSYDLWILRNVLLKKERILTGWAGTLVFLIWSLYLEDWGAGLGGSVGCAVRLETRRSRVQPPPRSATFFCRDWSWNIFYGHFLPSADSRRVVVSFWRKNVLNTA